MSSSPLHHPIPGGTVFLTRLKPILPSFQQVPQVLVRTESWGCDSGPRGHQLSPERSQEDS